MPNIMIWFLCQRRMIAEYYSVMCRLVDPSNMQTEPPDKGKDKLEDPNW